MQAQKKNDFSQGSVPKLITSLAIPMIGAQLVNALYSVVDRMYVARIPGEGMLALTGIGVTFPLLMIVTAFANLAGMGGAPLSSIARGEGRDDYAEKVLGNSFTMLVVFAVALTAIGLLIKDGVLMAFGASAETFPYANAYITIYLLGCVTVMFTAGMNPFINAQGFARVGMLTVVIGAVINIILDPIFIFALHMGVQGAALATVLAQAVSAVWVLWFLRSKRCIYRLKLANMRPDWSVIRRILALGVSKFTMSLTECTVQIVCNSTLQAFGGDTYVTVMTVINTVRQMILMALHGYTDGAQPVIGYNYGAKLYSRVRTAVNATTYVTLSYATLVWALMLLFPAQVMQIFNGDEAVIAAGIPAFRVYFAAFFAMFMQMTGQATFVALGCSKQATFFSLLRKAFIVAPLVLILPRLGMGVMGVFAAEPISDLVGSTACFIVMKRTLKQKLPKDDAATALKGAQ